MLRRALSRAGKTPRKTQKELYSGAKEQRKKKYAGLPDAVVAWLKTSNDNEVDRKSSSVSNNKASVGWCKLFTTRRILAEIKDHEHKRIRPTSLAEGKDYTDNLPR